jgi:hypothetical protein
VDELGGSAVEDEASLMEHEEAGIGVGLMGRERDHFVLRSIEVMHGKDKGILQAMCDYDGAGVGDVALLHNEFNDRG